MGDFEKLYSEFIDDNQYDNAEEVLTEMLFNAARLAYVAGWVAAGGEVPQTAEKLQFNRPSRVVSLAGTESN